MELTDGKVVSKQRFLFAGLLSFQCVGAAQEAARVAASRQYKVTLTNLVHGTPVSMLPSTPNTVFAGTSCVDANNVPRVGEMLGLWVVATTDSSFSLWTLGQPALPDLARLSQTGRPFYLANTLQSNNHVGTVFTIPANPSFTLPNPVPFPPATGIHDIVLCPGNR